MSCRERKENNREKNEYLVDGVLYKVKLREVGHGECEVIATPCNTPTSIYCICTIKKKENCCNEITYFEAKINSHYVQMIQGCSIEKIIEESIHLFFENNSLPFNNYEKKRKCCNGFGTFGF